MELTQATQNSANCWDSSPLDSDFIFDMKIQFQIKLRIVLVLATCGLMTTGCWSAHPHSAFRTIHQCAINGDAAGVSAELTKHPDALNLPEDDGLTSLHLAAENCHTNVVVLLLDKGANINVRAKDNATPLHLAAQEGCTDAVTVLLERAAKVNLRDDQKRTPLLRAEQWHQDVVAEILRQHGGTE
jgi:ankyrin repeat protein